MVDLTSLVLLAVSFFFVALSFALLVKYREVSERVNASTDLGSGMWSALERRLKKQDERILDMMGRVEVIQSRVTAASTVALAAASVPPPASVADVPRAALAPAPSHIAGPSVQRPESQESQLPAVPVGGPGPASELDETELTALKLLEGAAKDTRQLTDALGKSREHTARIMKGLFEAGLVRRNAASKPFVYELTDAGRGRLPAP